MNSNYFLKLRTFSYHDNGNISPLHSNQNPPENTPREHFNLKESRIVRTRRMSTLKKPIDFRTLENELDDALRADELYRLQNDAKIRAIEQRVPTYDHFRGMVQAAHLRPLERSEMQKRAEVSWNHCLNANGEAIWKTRNGLDFFVSDAKDKCISDVNFKPQNTAEFSKIWTSFANSAEKFNYLVRFRDDLINKYFKIEVPTEFLEEFIQVALDICSAETRAQIIELLHIFSECNRFSLSLVMISSSKKRFMQALFDKLFTFKSEACQFDELQALAKTYDVSFNINKE